MGLNNRHLYNILYLILLTSQLCIGIDDINKVATEQMTMDQLLMSYAESSTAMDFIADEDTVLVELDILYDKQEWKDIDSGRAEFQRMKRDPSHLGRKKRNAIHDKRWPNAEIPYIISNIFSTEDIANVKEAMNRYMKHTCLKFREARDSDTNRLLIQNGNGCSSYVGMTGVDQSLNLARGCRSNIGVIMHELGHASGFHHEQTRPDRDNYVTIYKDNIAPTAQFNFKKYGWDIIKDFNVPYDYTSIMHYGENAFSTNGQMTIKAADGRYQGIMGNRDGFSFNDIKLLNKMYECGGHCGYVPCPGDGYVGKDCRCYCPGNPVVPIEESTNSCRLQYGIGMPEASGNNEGASKCEDELGDICSGYVKAGYCKNEQHKDYMKAKCYKACGYCGDATAGETCLDKHKNCERWESSGMCTKSSYEKYMKDNCAKSCGHCGGVTTAKPTPKPTTPPTGDCRDAVETSKCQAWKQNNYCTSSSYASYMKKNCLKTCGFCGNDGKEECIDTNSGCPGWARSEMCTGYYSNYMKKNCRKSCNLCDEGSGTTEVETCNDQNVNCEAWATHGECTRNPAYMDFYCKKSCGTCGQSNDEILTSTTGDGTCKDLDKNCIPWARRGECNANRIYMKVQCKRACGFCGQQSDSSYTNTKVCKDRHPSCHYWVNKGSCRRTPKSMKKYCAKSCKFCSS